MKNRELLTYKLTNYYQALPTQETIFSSLKNDLIINLLMKKNRIYEYCKLLKNWFSDKKDELEIYYYVEHLEKDIIADSKESYDDTDDSNNKKQYFNYTVAYNNQKLRIKILFIEDSK
jgi:hypothetical protein